ncbi:c-type cytochrome [Alkalilacustris brevis]|uniref:c-type cytochrome n=1 Tax=Alkalilacustris brevis TaxID=2026338 RepID=UPI000E0D1D26|nr:cytochrome c [Alkalilacustris brevis]
MMFRPGIVAALLVPMAGWLAAPPAAAEVAQGRALYAAHCAVCHGADLEGAPDWRRPGPDGRLPAPPHDETGHTWHHGDDFLLDYTRRGGQAVLDDLGVRFDSGMPAFEGILSDAEIEAILAFIRASWPENIREFQAMRTEAERTEAERAR